jgi:ppGpp synthetase/RelA/SpoT-type nucleotidyltranferase
MSGLNRACRRYLESYTRDLSSIQQAAALAREIVERIARETGVQVHLVAARAKAIESMRGKLRRKGYKRPERRVTDAIGVRVITYYRDAVDPVVSQLKRSLEINQRDSVDKRSVLGLRQFGYRSVHLIARLKPGKGLTAAHEVLRDHWFEIQVRSILEHAWAEIDHEIVYKSGIEQPNPFLRRFAALAGGLEVLDNEFLTLRGERDRPIDGHVEKYKRNLEGRTSFDVARLLAFLEVARPGGRSWRQASMEGRPFVAGLELSCVEALKAVGLGTALSLRRMLTSQRFRYAVNSFATTNGIAPTEASHLACVVLAVMVKDVRIIPLHFPEMIYDPAIDLIVRRRMKR